MLFECANLVEVDGASDEDGRFHNNTSSWKKSTFDNGMAF